MESISTSVREFIRKEVPDWDDDVIATARFKAFSGQRSDWESKYHFWRDSILNISRHFGLFIINPSQLKNDWFTRGGLTPLCLDHVLFLMHSEGDIIRSVDIVDPISGKMSQLLKKVRNFMVRSSSSLDIMLEDHLILAPLLKERAAEVVKQLSETHWTSSCVITLKKLQGMCGGPNEASAILSYLTGCGKALYLSIMKKDLIKGVKVSLSAVAVSSISSLDYDILHLTWTTEKLQQQLEVIDQRIEISKRSALASLKSGNKNAARRYARVLKLASESRENCTSLLNRVEGVLNVIADAESANKVSEAIQIGARAIKENKISVEEVQVCLEDLEESILSQKQVENVLESTSLYAGFEDEDIEEEFKKMELEVESENPKVLYGKAFNIDEGAAAASESTELLSDALSNLKIADDLARESGSRNPEIPIRNNESQNPIIEAA
ncbi:Snf7 domain-containing protein [Cephalotus follicularis]|uniref:Snf7 domain-containing protein n=1 Tax=Cephalotus follicularis TaxID=3775 RepID=A0A1Q3BKQ3_CEPFO|nr:Snf7 domain-containing protein [Cephalotus follicularis]